MIDPIPSRGSPACVCLHTDIRGLQFGGTSFPSLPEGTLTYDWDRCPCVNLHDNLSLIQHHCHQNWCRPGCWHLEKGIWHLILLVLSSQLMRALNRTMGVLLASPLSALRNALAATSMTHRCLETAILGQMLCTVASVAFRTRCWLSITNLEHHSPWHLLQPSLGSASSLPVTLLHFSQPILRLGTIQRPSWRSGSDNRRCWSLSSLTPHTSQSRNILSREAPNWHSSDNFQSSATNLATVSPLHCARLLKAKRCTITEGGGQ